VQWLSAERYLINKSNDKNLMNAFIFLSEPIFKKWNEALVLRKKVNDTNHFAPLNQSNSYEVSNEN